MAHAKNPDLLDLLDADPGVHAKMQRDAIDAAVREVGAHGARFSSADIRPLVASRVDAHRIGNRLRTLARDGVIVKTGRWVASGNSKQRNATRPVHEYRLAAATSVQVRPI